MQVMNNSSQRAKLRRGGCILRVSSNLAMLAVGVVCRIIKKRGLLPPYSLIDALSKRLLTKTKVSEGHSSRVAYRFRAPLCTGLQRFLEGKFSSLQYSTQPIFTTEPLNCAPAVMWQR